MLPLKLALVPVFLLCLTLAGKRWGPAVSGWLAGLPIVAGPILFFLAVEHGRRFASDAAAAALSAVFASVAFSVAYAHAAQRHGWATSLLLAMTAWLAAAAGLSALPASAPLSLAVSLATLAAAPRLFPRLEAPDDPRRVTPFDLGGRMLAGALLTVAVTGAAGVVGPAWSGLLAVFPLLGIVLAVFSHRSQGPVFAARLLRGMATGLFAFVAFCLGLAAGLPVLDTGTAFALAVTMSLATQAATKRRVASPAPARPGPPARAQR